MRQPPHRFCDLVYAWAVERMTKENREQFDADMAAPTPEPDPVPLQDVPESVREQEGAAFMAMMGLPG